MCGNIHKNVILSIIVTLLIFPCWAHAEYIVAWGNNSWGECDAPAGGDFIAIAAGKVYSLGLKSDGALVGWGYSVREVPAGKYQTISACEHYMIALKTDGSIFAWSIFDEEPCYTPSGNDFITISAGYTHAAAIRRDGSVITWGYKKDFEDKDLPMDKGYKSVSVGMDCTVAIRSDGRIEAWGHDRDIVEQAPSDDGYVSVAVMPSSHYTNAYGLKSDGSVVVWGYETQKQKKASEIQGIKCKAITPRFHCLKNDGSLTNINKDLIKYLPEGNDYTAVAAGIDHYLALAREPKSYAERCKPKLPGNASVAGKPVAQNLKCTLTEDSSIDISLVGSDPQNEMLTYNIGIPPKNGKVSQNNGKPQLTYTPDINYYGVDRFSYYVRNTKSSSEHAWVELAVRAMPDKPFAQDIQVVTESQTPVEIDLLAFDNDGDALDYIIESQPQNGKLELVDAFHHVYQYTPNNKFNGEDLFLFSAKDQTLTSNIAKVNINVSPSMFITAYNRDQLVYAEIMPETLSVKNPTDLAAEREGMLYILSSTQGNSQILVCNDQLQVQRTLEVEADMPQGIAITKDHIYIADTGRNRILRYTKDGQLDTMFGNNGSIDEKSDFKYRLNRPWAVEVDNDGNIYVTDSGNNRVKIFDSQGKWKKQWRQSYEYESDWNRPRMHIIRDESDEEGFKEMYERPRSITSFSQVSLADRVPLNHPSGFFVNPRGVGGEIFMADTDNHRIKRLSMESGILISCIGKQGAAEGEFNRPMDVYYDLEFDQLVIADTGNDRIQILQLQSHGDFFQTNKMFYAQQISNLGLSKPKAVVTVIQQPWQILFVADTGNNRVVKIKNNILRLENSPLVVWEEFKAALLADDVDKAVICFIPFQQEKYREIYQKLRPHFKEMVQGMGEMILVEQKSGFVKYEMIHEENNKKYCFPVYFSGDEEGNWKISQF